MTSDVDTSKPGVYEVKYNYTNAEEVIRKVTVTKKESSIKQVTLTVNLNGGSLLQTLKTKYKVGEKVTLSIPTKNGYIFTGWTVTGTGSKIEGNILTIGSEDVTLKANYTLQLNAVDHIANLYRDETERESNGLIKDDTGDNNIRYSGENPKNYVSFNDETWRIIGTFLIPDQSDSKFVGLKIIRNNSLDNLSWNGVEGTGNFWPYSTLFDYLNNMYYAGSTTTCYNPDETTCPENILNDKAFSMIEVVNWNMGEVNYSVDSKRGIYAAEKKENHLQ